MNTIYIVEGTTGEYDDRSEWPVHSFANEDKACQLAERLNAWCKEKGCEPDGPNASNSFQNDQRPEEDPGFLCYYTGTRYYVYPVPFGG